MESVQRGGKITRITRIKTCLPARTTTLGYEKVEYQYRSNAVFRFEQHEIQSSFCYTDTVDMVRTLMIGQVQTTICMYELIAAGKI